MKKAISHTNIDQVWSEHQTRSPHGIETTKAANISPITIPWLLSSSYKELEDGKINISQINNLSICSSSWRIYDQTILKSMARNEIVVWKKTYRLYRCNQHGKHAKHRRSNIGFYIIQGESFRFEHGKRKTASETLVPQMSHNRYLPTVNHVRENCI